MRYVLFVCVLSCLRLSLTAQVDTDSLLALAAAIPEENNRAAQLDTWVAGRKLSEFTRPAPLFEARLALAKRAGDFQKELLTAIGLIHACNYTGHFGRADSLSLHYVAEVDRAERPRVRAMLYYEAAKTAYFGQNYRLSIAYDSSALAIIPLIDDVHERDSLRVRAMNYLGQAFNSSGQFVPAALTFTDAIDAARATGQDSSLMLELYTGLGIIYSQIGLYDRAVDYLDRSAVYGADLPAGSKAVAQVNIGRNLLLVGDYAGARDRYLRAARYPVASNERVHIYPYVYNGLVEAHYRSGDRDSVNHYYGLFSQMLREYPDESGGGGFLYRQSTWLHQLENDRLELAEKTGLSLLQEARKSNDPADLMLYTELLAITYRKKNDFERADALTRELMVRKDSVQSANRSNALLLHYNQFETKEKENEILRLDAERERVTARQRQFQLVAGLLALLLLMGGYFFVKLRTARRKLAGQNEQLSRLNATKDRFFSIIAHDIRNPIVALQTADWQVGRLYEQGREKEIREAVSSISETAGRLSGLLDNLLQWALSQSDAIKLKQERIPLAPQVAEIVELYQPAASAKSITLVNRVDKATEVFADPNALQTILRNLVGNAVKFSGGQEPSVVTLSYRLEDGMDVVVVQDQGPGVREDVRRQLFELHRQSGTTGRRTYGTGLGLILCRDLAELHGGKLSLESEEGKGAEFSVWLPAR